MKRRRKIKFSCEEQRQAASYSSDVAFLPSFCHFPLKLIHPQILKSESFVVSIMTLTNCFEIEHGKYLKKNRSLFCMSIHNQESDNSFGKAMARVAAGVVS